MNGAVDKQGSLDDWRTLRSKSPFDPSCPFHLRRVCGNCKHGPELRAGGTVKCAHYLFDVHAVRNAAGCTRFERPMAGAQQ